MKKTLFPRALGLFCAVMMLIVCTPALVGAEETPLSILSGNTFDSSDATYGSYQTLDTGATYSWDSQITDSGILNMDTGCTAMTDGIIKTGQSTHSEWINAQVAQAVAIFDLKSNYNVSRVDVWTEYNVTGVKQGLMDYFRVEVSTDGQTYTTVGEYRNTYSGPETYICVNTIAEFEPVEARYVKITAVEAENCGELRLDEMVVIGAVSAAQKVQKLLDKAEGITDSTLYTSASWGVFQTAVANARAILGRGDATDAELQEAFVALQTAMDNLTFAFPEKIISGNAATADMQTCYPDALYAHNGVEYSWEDGTDSLIATHPDGDVYCVKMTDGLFLDAIGSNVAWSSYNTGSAADGIAKFNLKDEYYISQVDVWVLKDASVGLMSNFDVEVSMDGVEFTKVCTANYTGAPAQGRLVCTRAKFLPVKAQYVRITTHKAVGNGNYVIGEMVIKGFQNRVDKTELYNALYKINNLDKEIYTEESWSQVAAAQALASEVYLSQTATQDDVFNAISAINTAISNLVCKYNLKIISNNAFVGGDLVYYPPDKEEREETNVTYTYAENSNPIFREWDTNCTKLIGGHIDNHEGTYTTGSGWMDQPERLNPGIAVFDFGAEYYIGQVDVWSAIKMAASGIEMMGSFKVELSLDGVNYTEVASAVNPYEGYELNFETTVNTVAKFPIQKARYVRISIYRLETAEATAMMETICEVVIHGFAAPFKPNVSFDITEIHYTDQNGADIYLGTLGSISKLNVDGKIFNNTDSDKNVKVITAIYNANNVLVGMRDADVQTIARQKVDFSITFDSLPQNMTADYMVKTFVWESFDTCLPLTSYKVLGVLD